MIKKQKRTIETVKKLTRRQRPLFKVVLVEPEETLLGYKWIEVLAFLPFRAVPQDLQSIESNCYETTTAWRYVSWILIRTERGLGRILDEDLFAEIDEGLYVEEGTPEKVLRRDRKFRVDRAKMRVRRGMDGEESE